MASAGTAWRTCPFQPEPSRDPATCAAQEDWTLSGSMPEARELGVREWRVAWTGDPTARLLVEALVRQQDSSSFMLGPDGFQAAGAPVELAGAPVLLAHRVEMELAEARAWREALRRRGCGSPSGRCTTAGGRLDLDPQRYEELNLPDRCDAMRELEERVRRTGYEGGECSLP